MLSWWSELKVGAGGIRAPDCGKSEVRARAVGGWFLLEREWGYGVIRQVFSAAVIFIFFF